MTAIKSQHSKAFEQLISQRLQILTEAIAGGLANDYAHYRDLVGQITGLSDALKISEAADFQLSGEEPNVGA